MLNDQLNMLLLLQVHLAPGSKFDFQKYIKRSLEDDFKVIVGIRYGGPTV